MPSDQPAEMTEGPPSRTPAQLDEPRWSTRANTVRRQRPSGHQPCRTPCATSKRSASRRACPGEPGRPSQCSPWIDGESGPAGWAKVIPESGLRRWCGFCRLQYHDAVACLPPRAHSAWSSGTGTLRAHTDHVPRRLPALERGCWQGDDIVGLIDFDYARPAPPLRCGLRAGLARGTIPTRNASAGCAIPARRIAGRRIEVSATPTALRSPDDVSSPALPTAAGWSAEHARLSGGAASNLM